MELPGHVAPDDRRPWLTGALIAAPALALTVALLLARRRAARRRAAETAPPEDPQDDR